MSDTSNSNANPPVLPDIKKSGGKVQEEEIQQSHDIIEQNIQAVTGDNQPAGHSVPPVNTTPLSPLAVIQGDSSKEMEQRTKIIAEITPDTFKTLSTGDKSSDHLLGLDSNRYTSSSNFEDIRKQRDIAQSKTTAEVKKAA